MKNRGYTDISLLGAAIFAAIGFGIILSLYAWSYKHAMQQEMEEYVISGTTVEEEKRELRFFCYSRQENRTLWSQTPYVIYNTNSYIKDSISSLVFYPQKNSAEINTGTEEANYALYDVKIRKTGRKATAEEIKKEMSDE